MQPQSPTAKSPPQCPRPRQPARKWARRLASSSTSRRAAARSGANGFTSTRPPSKRQVPATWPSTRKVGTECGVFVLKTSGRYGSGRIWVRRACTSNVASQVGRNRTVAGVDASGSGALGRSTSSFPCSSRERRRENRARPGTNVVDGLPPKTAISLIDVEIPEILSGDPSPPLLPKPFDPGQEKPVVAHGDRVDRAAQKGPLNHVALLQRRR